MAGWEELRVGRTAEQSPPEGLQFFDPATAFSAASAAAAIVVVSAATAVVASLFATATSCCVSPPGCVDTHLPFAVAPSGVGASAFAAQSVAQIVLVAAGVAIAISADSSGEIDQMHVWPVCWLAAAGCISALAEEAVAAVELEELLVVVAVASMVSSTESSPSACAVLAVDLWSVLVVLITLPAHLSSRRAHFPESSLFAWTHWHFEPVPRAAPS